MEFSISLFQWSSQSSCGYSLRSERCTTGQQPLGILIGSESSSKISSRVPLLVCLPRLLARLSPLIPLYSRVRDHLWSYTCQIWHPGLRRWPCTNRCTLWCPGVPKSLLCGTSPLWCIPFSPLCLCYARGSFCRAFLSPPSQTRLGICLYSLQLFWRRFGA